jgi:hypothetical protein
MFIVDTAKEQVMKEWKHSELRSRLNRAAEAFSSALRAACRQRLGPVFSHEVLEEAPHFVVGGVSSDQSFRLVLVLGLLANGVVDNGVRVLVDL